MPTAIHTSEQASQKQSHPEVPPPEAARLHALGSSALRSRDFDRAAVQFSHAIQIAGPLPEYCENLAQALLGAGKLKQSAACYQQAIAVDPGNLGSYLGLARVLIHDNRAAEAVTYLKQALIRMPQAAEAWALLGAALNLTGRTAFAAEALCHALDLEPSHAAWHYDLGLVLGQLGDLDKAEAAYRRAIQLNPDFPEALNNLGNLLRRRNKPIDAADSLRRALKMRPDYTDAKYNLGLVLQDLDLLEDAETCYREVLAAEPCHHAAGNNYGNVLMGLGRIDEALSRYADALRLAPSNRTYRVNAAMAQLLTGDFRQGWVNYAARVAPAISGVPPWNGELLKGRTILLLSEQGMGDTIQFIRYARCLQQEGARVLARCPAPLVELLRSALGVESVIPDDQPPPPCDWYVPLMHLPAFFGTRLGTIPAETPYVFANPDRVREWGSWMSKVSNDSNLRVGIAWCGGGDHWNDRNRSMDASFLAPLKDLEGLRFFSLQKSHPTGCDGLEFTPLPRELDHFADTAGLMDHLDLIISVDTSVAHLAGALGRPAWVLLPFAPDWRWMLDRDDSPWYPGLRLFRQKRRGDWLQVLERVREALQGRTRVR